MLNFSSGNENKTLKILFSDTEDNTPNYLQNLTNRQKKNRQTLLEGVISD